MSTTAKKETPHEQKVIDALGAAEGEVTVDEVAAAAGIGRTSARKYLATLEDAGKVERTAGGREGKRRLPDRYSPISGEEPRPEAAVVDEPPDDGPAERLRPGGLDRLGPTAVAKGLERSSGAVGNCLARLAGTEKVELVRARPRRYVMKEG
ncbi:MAG: helix-turn-helix domain-containing protein [Actinobacteria bacterium]|nr:helix-turn-helix domain-containing protein [Actinomycetota bacterium]